MNIRVIEREARFYLGGSTYIEVLTTPGLNRKRFLIGDDENYDPFSPSSIELEWVELKFLFLVLSKIIGYEVNINHILKQEETNTKVKTPTTTEFPDEIEVDLEWAELRSSKFDLRRNNLNGEWKLFEEGVEKRHFKKGKMDSVQLIESLVEVLKRGR